MAMNATRLHKAGVLLKTAWLLVGLVIAMVLAVEGALSAAFKVKDRLAPARHQEDPRIGADAYTDRSWVLEYYQEFELSGRDQWAPYVYFRRRPFKGRYINVDDRGLRVTPQAPAAARESDEAARVFMFGGSTMWGTGVRDAATIPASLARELKERGVSCQVTNFGESGYVSTQEVIALMLELQRGNVPDLVIFYDGANDAYSAYQQNEAGIPQNERNRAREFGVTLPTRRGQLRRLVLTDAVGSSATARFLSGLLGRLGVAHKPWTPAPLHPVADTAQSGSDLPERVCTVYYKNAETVAALSEHFGFEALFYWQPTLFQKERMSEYERARRQEASAFEPFVLDTYRAFRAGRSHWPPGIVLRDLSGFFSTETAPTYLDWCHTGEAGTAEVAAAMVDDVAEALEQLDTSRAPGQVRAR